MSLLITERGKAYTILVAFTVALAVILDYRLLTLTSLLISLLISMRIYAEISLGVLEDLEVEVSAHYTIEKEPLVVHYKLINRRIYSLLHAEYSLEYESALSFIKGAKAGLLIVPGNSSIELVFVFKARTGTHWIGPLRVVVRDLLGLFKSQEIRVGRRIEVSIPPTVEPVIVRKLYTFTRSVGLVKTRSPGEGVEFYDVREYRVGDELKRVVWRVYASRNKLAVWEAERESYQGVVYVLGAHRDMWTGPYNQSVFEHSARIVASIAQYTARRGYAQALIVFNELGVRDSGRLVHGVEGFNRIVETISKTRIASSEEVSQSTTNWKYLVERFLTILPRERAFVFIFTRTGSGMWQYLLDIALKLKALGHAVYIAMPVITAYDIPRDLPESLYRIYRAKQLLLLREDLEGIVKLRELGVRVIAMTPLHVAQRIIQLIESATWTRS